MTDIRTRRALLFALTVSAFPAVAQNRPASSPVTSDIIVVGHKDADQDKKIQEFVRNMTRSPGTEPIARWDASASCPQTFGLNPNDNQAITDRMRRVATAANVNLAPPDCKKVNVVVIFATDKDAMIDILRKSAPDLFVDAHGDRIHFTKDDEPAVSWHVKGLVDRGGRRLYAPNGEPFSLLTSDSPSRLEAMTQPVYLTSMVVIERQGAIGLTTTQLADYAVMRAYTDASPARAAKVGAPTILTVLKAPMGGETRKSMTNWDLALLKGLYAVPATLLSSAQQGAIAASMKRELDKTNNIDRRGNIIRR